MINLPLALFWWVWLEKPDKEEMFNVSKLQIILLGKDLNYNILRTCCNQISTRNRWQVCKDACKIPFNWLFIQFFNINWCLSIRAVQDLVIYWDLHPCINKYMLEKRSPTMQYKLQPIGGSKSWYVAIYSKLLKDTYFCIKNWNIRLSTLCCTILVVLPLLIHTL